ncbi:MAG: 2-C-methyl-D-erythritol 4-phosphate cytidylyltransferase [Bacteroidaceae bacterium]|nr:2-C-methyl-D-erythritol 4-phosphate cytidylyltransferase [Bacteroidaceae bacterium]
MNFKKYAIIVAGGKGLRMGGDLPKQFIPVEGRPVLMRTLDTFHACDPSIQLILVLPPDHQPYWQELCREYGFRVPHRIADGGATRFHSVQSGLALVGEPDALVAVHDGVRPFVSREVIARCYAEAEAHGAAVPVVPVVETVRQLLPEGSKTVSRDAYRLVQTPQTFRAPLLRRAYEQPFCEAFTDDASVVEALGHAVHLVEGNRENIKLTTPFDLIVARALVQSAG